MKNSSVNIVAIIVLGCASFLFAAEKNRAILQQVFGKELYAVPALRAKAQTSEEKIKVQEKKAEQFVAFVRWARGNGCSQDETDELERELESCQEEKKE